MSGNTVGNGLAPTGGMPRTKPETSVLEQFLGLGTGRVASGSHVVPQHPLLAGHRGTRPDMILRWNEMSRADRVDVVVHLHGYSIPGRRMDLRRDILSISGLDFGDPANPSTRGRVRPTLAVLPRGGYIGDQPGRRPSAYDFPALVGKGALNRLVDDALARFGAVTKVRARRGRLILTAHSGGGKALMGILAHGDAGVDEVFAYDALYWDPANLLLWAKARIARDNAAAGDPASAGSLRVLYGRSTLKKSVRMHVALEALLRQGVSPAIRRRYRVERTSVGHCAIPRRYGWRLLADAGADLPSTQPPPGR